MLLTYQEFFELGVWKRFLKFVRSQFFQWKVQYWCATLKTNSDDTFHLHLALQFYSAADRTAQAFIFEDVTPNARANDLLGEGWCGKKWQESVDRAFFYVRANRVGTCWDSGGPERWALRRGKPQASLDQCFQHLRSQRRLVGLVLASSLLACTRITCTAGARHLALN